MCSISNRIRKVSENKKFVTRVEKLYIRAIKATDATAHRENNSESDSSIHVTFSCQNWSLLYIHVVATKTFILNCSIKSDF